MAMMPALLLCFACSSRVIPPNPPPHLADAVNTQAARVGDLTPVSDLVAGVTHDEDESFTLQVPLKMNKCYYFSVAADQTVDEMKLYLFNGNGKRTLTKEEKGQALLANFCVTGQVVVAGWGWGTSIASASPGLYKIELKTTEGYGHVHIRVFSKSTE